jgi:ferric-dicitrate binding protein FerR (iron transport regulator)
MNPRAELPDEEATPTWLADALDEVRVPAPRPALRDSLCSRFVDVQEPARAPEDTPSREAAGAPLSPRSLRRRSRGPAAAKSTRRWRGGWLLLSGLVAASLVLWVLRPKALPRVELVDCVLASLTLDGKPADAHEFERRLLGGARVRTAQTAARVRLDGVTLIELAPNSEVVFTPWGEAGGEARIELARGGVRVATAPDFAPRKLTVRAPDAQIAIVGTELGVDVLEGVGTCVCCTHGAIEVRPRGRERAERVLAGGMAFCFSSREAPMLGAVKDDHAAEVVALRRFAWPAARR